MNIAIIGAGNVGSALGSGLRRTGHSVTLSATSAEKAQAVADSVGASAASSPADAARDADVVVLAVPYGAVAELAMNLQDSVRGKVVVDATNPLNADFSGLAVTERSGAEEIQALFPDAHVVKALNTVLAANQADPVVDGTALDGFYAGNDEAAKNAVRTVLGDLGFRPIEAGELAAARALEYLAFLNISLNARNGWAWQSGWKLVGPTG